MFGHFTYLSLELLWGLPVLAIQWFVGYPALIRSIKLLLPSVAVPTIYLSAADGIAIRSGIWALHGTRLVGLYVGDVPLEEVLFFFLTNLMITQTIVLVVLSPSLLRMRLPIGKSGAAMLSRSGKATSPHMDRQ